LPTCACPASTSEKEYRRYYPGGEVMAHILGFTDVEDIGQEGIELALRQAPGGSPGSAPGDQGSPRPDRRGRRGIRAAARRRRRGAVDRRQDPVSRLVARCASAIEEHKAKAGAAVVLDVRSGEVLALANRPPSTRTTAANLTGAQLRNRVFTDAFEPGSVMKPFIAALALDRGKVRPMTPIDTGNGR
jgi:cell division protein FtsI (penicillin-binding protein 3)